MSQWAFTPNKTLATSFCCVCSCEIEPNAANMCINCIRNQVDISEGIPKQIHIQFCRNCLRYNQPPHPWLYAELESKELLAFLLKRIRGLNKVKLIDAVFVWTEPHSKRLKIQVTIQKEVLSGGTILQQSFVIEYVVSNMMCPDCHKVEADILWTAVAQVRQRVTHKRTFYWLEQVILKHNAHSDCINIVERGDGLDFFFNTSQKCRRFVDFLSAFVPLRFATTKKLISWDEQNNIHKYKESFSVEMAPVCKDDLICLPSSVAHKAGTISPLVVCLKVTNSLHVMDCNTLQHAEINTFNFWKDPFKSIANAKQMVVYMVLDIELTGESWGKYALADVEVCRDHELGSGISFITRTHLGNILNHGDTVAGYDLSALAFNENNIKSLRNKDLPDVVLVRKLYPERRSRQRQRIWKLKRLNMDVEDESNRIVDQRRREEDYEHFLRDLEEEKELRDDINLYADRHALALENRRLARKAMRRAERRSQPTAMDDDAMPTEEGGDDSADDDSEDSELDDQFPVVELTELLEDLSLRSEASEAPDDASDDN